MRLAKISKSETKKVCSKEKMEPFFQHNFRTHLPSAFELGNVINSIDTRKPYEVLGQKSFVFTPDLLAKCLFSCKMVGVSYRSIASPTALIRKKKE